MSIGNVTWKLVISIDNHYLGQESEIQGTPLGLNIEDHETVRVLAKQTGFDIVSHKKLSNREYVGIEVNEPPDSPRLTKLLQTLDERYGYKPWPNTVFDMRQRDRFFGVQRIRTFRKKEIDTAEYLSFFCSLPVGHAVFRSEEDFALDRYVVDKVASLKKDPAMGCLQPFNALAVMPRMRKLLLEQGLVGLDLYEEVIGSKGNLFKLGSNIILPRSLTRLVNGQGEDVDPDVWKVVTVHGNTEEHLFDDGHKPCILRYGRVDFERHTPFDVAMRYEFIGNHKQGAYRGLIVSQRFRQVLKELKVRGTHYFPIQLE